MKKSVLIGIIIGIVILLGIVAGIYIYFSPNLEIEPDYVPQECNTDEDCMKGESSPLEGMPFYPPCFRGECQNPKNSEEWIEYCNMKGLGSRSLYTWNCYLSAAYYSLKKSSPSGNYTIEWDEAFRICEKYVPEDVERCKADVCDNLHLGDSNMKYNYPEQIECYRLSREFTGCDDNIKNGGETDIDCGSDCDPCVNGKGCLSNTDCLSDNCDEFKCYNICPNGLISENKPCGCNGVKFDSVTEGIPIGLYCCDDKTQREECSG